MYISGLIVGKSKVPIPQSKIVSLEGRENMDLLFNSDIMNLLLKPMGGETEDVILLFL